MTRGKKLGTWARRAKVPGPRGAWMKHSEGHEHRSDQAKRDASAERALADKLDTVLGRASYVDDLMEECGYGRR